MRLPDFESLEKKFRCSNIHLVSSASTNLLGKMSLFFGRVSLSVLKGPMLGSLSKRLIRLSSCVCFVRHPNYHQLMSSQNRGKEFVEFPECSWKSFTLLDVTKQFSTTSSLLAQQKAHDHSKLWTFERLLSAILLPLVPATLIYPSQTLDTALAVIVVLHVHFGLEAVVVDYVRPILFGELIPKIGMGLLYLLSIITLAGLLNLIYNDTGLANTLITIWKK